MVGHIRGGLGMSNVVACTLFGGVSGSPVADVSAMGAVMIPMMKKEGYHADYAVNVTTHAALVGALMPTSHNMIIYALAAGGKVSIGALILAGLLPALVLTICMLVAAYLVAVKRGYPAGAFPGWDAVARTFAAAVPGLLDRRASSWRASCPASSPRPSRPRSRSSTRRADLLRLPHDDVGEVPEGGGQSGEDDRRGAAADRRLDDVQYLIGLYEVAELTGELMARCPTTPG